MATTNASQDPMRAVGWALVLGSLFIGWFFIVWQNKFHMTAPTVMLCLGYLAVVATVANLWRVGAAAVAPEDASADAWSRPIGERDELEKEKKTLLKAIKEAEFDHEMGKLSQADADQLITMYKTRAIAVIKELERLDGIEAAQDKRGQIEREIAARLALESGGKKKAEKAAKAAKKAAAKEAAAKEAAAKAAKEAEAGKFATPPSAGAEEDDDDDDDGEDEVAPKEPTRPSQRSFTTSNEGDSTPLPPPTADEAEDSKPGPAAEKAETFAEPPKTEASKDESKKEASS